VKKEEPVVVAPKFRSFSSDIFSQASQNDIVKVRVDRNVRRNKFTANNPARSKSLYRLCYPGVHFKILCRNMIKHQHEISDFTTHLLGGLHGRFACLGSEGGGGRAYDDWSINAL
jgi:hypothetical protein